MNVKTYRSKSLQGALDHIKRDLGSDALVLSTREIPRSFSFIRKPKWEVTAASKPAPEAPAVIPAATLPAPGPAAQASVTPPAKAPFRSVIPVPSGTAAAAAAPAKTATTALAEPADIDEEPRNRRGSATDRRIDVLLEEMDELKRSLKSISRSIPSAGEHPSSGLYGELVTQGIDPGLADNLILSASYGNPTPAELRNRVRRLLGDALVVDPPAELHAKSRIVSIFVGPTGAGKTTVIAKIAGQASTRFKKKVAAITTDMMRIGGQEQLTRYGALLGVPAYTCSDPATLKSTIESLGDYDLILVDTPGASPSDLTRLSRLESLLTLSGARVNLVLSAATRSDDIAKTVKRFQRIAATRAIITKVDETDSRGAVVGDLLRNEVAISYITNGQRVPDDLLVPLTNEMAKWVLPDA
jgi:flagellar biosynthesis protein FlhF